MKRLLRRHEGLCDRDCPKCGSRDVAHWKANFVTKNDERVLELGYFFCEVCGWRSEYSEFEIRSLDGRKA